MFSFHKPRVYRSTEGCCICRAKSSSSRFTDSKKYEDDSMKCFNLEKARQGEICNACVLLVKRFKRLPAGSNRHWGHVVDARIGPGMKSMTKFKKLKEESVQRHQLTEHSKVQSGRSSIPEKFCKIFKKNKKKHLKDKILKEKREGTPASWDEQSLPPTPESLNSDCEEIQYSNYNSLRANMPSRYRRNRRKNRKPLKNRNKNDNVNFFDENVWKRLNSCCGIVYENSDIGALIIDIQSYKPCSDHIHITNKNNVVETIHSGNIKTEHKRFITNQGVSTVVETQNIIKRPIIIQNDENPISTPALKKHHLYFKRQLENFARAEIMAPNQTKTDFDSSTTRQHDEAATIIKQADASIKMKHSLLHKIKTDTGKIVKHSLEKMSTLRIKQADVSEIKNLIKMSENSVKLKSLNDATIQSIKQTDSSGTKFSDNSSDSGFDENLQERKSVSPLQEDDDNKEKKVIVRPAQAMFLASGMQVQGQQQNLILTANEVAAKMLQSRRQQSQLAIKHAQSSGSQKVRAIFNPTAEALVNLAGNATSPAVLNITPSVPSLNQKIILVKAKYNPTSNNN